MKRFRPNVCAVVADNQESKVLVFRRVDQVLGENRWQFPQGGLDNGELPEQGLLRELKEEIGTDDVQIIRKAPQTISYEFPQAILEALQQSAPEKTGFDGQEQHWFLVRLNQGDTAIHFDHQPQEFDAFRWVTPQEALALVVDFKRSAYLEGLSMLGLVEK